MLTSTASQLASRSGYSLLGQYVPDAIVVNVPRKPAASLSGRICQAGIRHLAFTTWYQSGSLSLEWQAAKRMFGGFEGVVHMLWADSDLGFLDYLRRPRQPLCCTFHMPARGLSGLIRNPDRLKRLDRIVLMSSGQAEFFLEHGVDAERISVVHHGVDSAYYSRKPQYENDKCVVLFVGSYQRNFNLLKQICVDLRSREDIEFHIVTGHQQRALFEGLPNVRFLSGISDECLLSEYQSASCFLVTVEDSTANNALLEAMSCGLPVVAEDVGGVREYVSDDAAFLVPKLDARKACERIVAIAESPELRSRMAVAARNRALEFDWTRVAASMVDLYQGMLLQGRN